MGVGGRRREGGRSVSRGGDDGTAQGSMFWSILPLTSSPAWVTPTKVRCRVVDDGVGG